MRVEGWAVRAREEEVGAEGREVAGRAAGAGGWEGEEEGTPGCSPPSSRLRPGYCRHWQEGVARGERLGYVSLERRTNMRLEQGREMPTVTVSQRGYRCKAPPRALSGGQDTQDC